MFLKYGDVIWQLWSGATIIVLALLAAIALLVLFAHFVRHTAEKEQEKERQLEEIALAYKHPRRSP